MEKQEPMTVLIHRIFEQDENIDYDKLVLKWKQQYPSREVPNASLFQYARKTWRNKKKAVPAHAPVAVKKKPGPKPGRKKKLKKVANPEPAESPVGGMLERLEADLDKLIATAGQFRDKESEAMSRKMRRLVSSRILTLEEVK